MCIDDCFEEALCPDVEPDIIKDPNVSRLRRYSIIFFMFVLACTSLVTFILYITWFKRITPWYMFGETISLALWICVLIEMVVTILSCAFFVLFVTLGLFTNITCLRGIFGSFNSFTWFGVAFGISSFIIGSASSTIFKEKIPCYKAYNACLVGNFKKLLNSKDVERYDKFNKWNEDILNNFDNICYKIIKPAFILEIVSFVVYLITMILMTGCCCCKYDPQQKSENEDDGKANKNPDNPNDNNNQNEKVNEDVVVQL